MSTYDPEKGSARDLPRERYLRSAYLLMVKDFGPTTLAIIAARGEAEFQRVCGEVYSANGFLFTRDELSVIFHKLEAKAKIDHDAEMARLAWIDTHGRSETVQ